jgi:hypothetical protein
MTENPETYLAITLIARIHPGDREAIDEAIQTVLCPFGHFDEPGDTENWQDPDCRMDWFASTVTDDIEKAFHWVVPDLPDDASALEKP